MRLILLVILLTVTSSAFADSNKKGTNAQIKQVELRFQEFIVELNVQPSPKKKNF